MKIRVIAAVSLLVVCCSALAGCSGAAPCSVSGTVTFDGEPLETGNIKFEPLEESEGASASAPIEAGQYKVALEKGMLAGKFNVSISATRATGKQVHQFDSTTAMMPEVVQFIPERYNRLSELTAELHGGENTQDFTLTSKP